MRTLDIVGRDIFDSFFNDEYVTAKRNLNTRIKSTEDHLLVTMDVPGVGDNDLNLEIKGDQIFLEAKRDGYEYKESFSVDKKYDLAKAEANLEYGVLYLAIPKAESERTQKIKISQNKSNFLDRFIGDNK